MNTAAANRHRVNLIHAERGTSRNNASGGGVRRKGSRRPRPEPSGRRAELRGPQHGVEGGRRIA